ncbi:MAG: ATP-binding protein, partial [Euryarchaeota archaeon]|nr:ATP-binding protein [Euryarchaeota archaeon]
KTSDPQKIVYVSMDDLLGRVDCVHDLISTYFELTGIDPAREDVHIFLDEIHVRKGWQTELKYYLDAHAACKFIVSGSSKTLLYKDASESLVGRIRFVDVFPLTFREFAAFNGVLIDRLHARMGDFQELEKAYFSVITQKERLVYLMNLYLDVGGYPEWFKVCDVERWYRVLAEDYFSLILFRDIVGVFRVKDPILLERLTRDIAVFSTERFTYRGLSERLGVDRETLKLYLYYLTSSMLISIADVYTRSGKAVEKREKKLYFCEEGLRKALTLDGGMGRAAENVVAWHLIKRGYGSKVFFKPYYWKKKYEVDFIYDDSMTVLPVEVKYREHVASNDAKGLLEFMCTFDLSTGIMVTMNKFGKEEIRGRDVLFIPIWFFLLVL